MGWFDGEAVITHRFEWIMSTLDARVLRLMAQEEDGTAKVYIWDNIENLPEGCVFVEVLSFMLPLLNKTIERFNARGGFQIDLEEAL